MRLVSQVATLAIAAGLAAAGWYGWQRYATAPVPAQAQAKGGMPPVVVEVVQAQRVAVSETAVAVGTARARESVTLTAKQNGIVAKLGFTEGQKVKTGQVLIEFELRERQAELEQARAELEQSKAQREEIRVRWERARALRNSAAMADAKLDDLDQQLKASEARSRMMDARIRVAEARLEDQRILAPFDGRIGLRQISLGALVKPGDAITTLDDLSLIKVEFSLPQTVLDRLKLGLPVRALSTSTGDRAFTGTLTAIDSRADSQTRSIRVNALFDNSEEALKPGVFMAVEVELGRRENAVVVPEDAVVPQGVRSFVFVVREGRAEQRPVILGTRQRGTVEIKEGLQPGEDVVVRGVQKLRDKQAVAPRPFLPQS